MAVTKGLVCATCLVSGVKPTPEAVTQISGTLLCAPCATLTADSPGSAARDPALRARRHDGRSKIRPGDALTRQTPD